MLWSPDTIVPKPSEKTYRSPRKPSAKLPLPSVRDSPSVDLTVVIPAYNETARLPDMFSSTLAHLEATRTSQGRSYEVLVVDDGSRDGTADLALKLGTQYPQSDVRVVVLEKNVGKGGAVRHGMLHGRGRRLLMVDADGASRFEDLELLWKAMDEISPKGEAAVVVGSRAHLVKTEAVVKVRSFISVDSTSLRASPSPYKLRLPCRLDSAIRAAPLADDFAAQSVGLSGRRARARSFRATLSDVCRPGAALYDDDEPARQVIPRTTAPPVTVVRCRVQCCAPICPRSRCCFVGGRRLRRVAWPRA